MTMDNSVLGRFELSGIPPAPRGIPKIEVTFELDANGILNVTAKEESTGLTKKIWITNDNVRLAPSDIDHMINEAARYKDEDDRQLERVARASLESYVLHVKAAVEGCEDDRLSEDEKRMALQKCKDAIEWLDCNLLGKKQNFDGRLEEMRTFCEPVISKLHTADRTSEDFCIHQLRTSIEEID